MGSFDDPNLMANAALMLAATSVDRLDLEAVVNTTVRRTARAGESERFASERRVLAESSGPLRHGDRTEPSRRHARADHATGELTYRRCLPSRLGSYRGLHQGRDRVGLSDQSVDRSDAPFVTSASARPANVSTNALRCSAVTGYGLATASSPSLLVPAYGMAIGGSSKTFTTLSGPIGRLIPISGREGPHRAGFYCVPNW